MKDLVDLEQQVLAIVRAAAPVDVQESVTSQTKIFTDIDLDSLAMLELFEVLRARFGVDLLAVDASIGVLLTPQAISNAIRSYKSKDI